MGKTTNRVLSIILAVLMVLSSVSVITLPALADSNSSQYYSRPADPTVSGDVDPSAAGVYVLDTTITGTGTYTLDWNGTTYTKSIGTDAFASIEEIEAKIEADGETDPKILVKKVGEHFNLIVRTPAKYYTEASNIMPYTKGTKVDGSDWAANAAFDAKAISVDYILIGPAIPAEATLEFHGFTINARYIDAWRTLTGSKVVTVLNNIKIDQNTDSLAAPGNIYDVDSGTTTTDGYATIDGVKVKAAWNYGIAFHDSGSASSNDIFYAKNVYYAKTIANTRLWGANVHQDVVTFDGLFIDRTNVGTGGIAYISSKNTANNHIVYKNSNITNFNVQYEGYNKVGGANTATLTFDNCILYKLQYEYGSTIANNHLFNVFQAAYTEINFLNNTIIGRGNNSPLIWNRRPDDNPSYNTVYVNIVGNRLIGLRDNLDFVSGSGGFVVKGAVTNFARNYCTTTLPADLENITAEGVKFYNSTATDTAGNYGEDDYYLDFAMTLCASDARIAAVSGLGDSVTIGDTKIEAIMTGSTDTVTPVFTTKGEGAAVKMYSDAAYTNEITSIDLSQVDGVVSVYVVSTKETLKEEYTLTITTAESSDFVEALENGEFGTLTYDNTMVYVEGLEIGETTEAFWNGKLYSFTVENEVVFSDMAALNDGIDLLKEFGAEEVYILLPAGEYSGFEISKAATYLGYNNGINPVDKTVENVTDAWKLNSAWAPNGVETGVDTISIAAGTEGTVTIDGLTLRNQLNDTDRTLDSGKLTLNVQNIVVDHIADVMNSNVSGAPVPFNSGAGTSYYTFNFNNARSANATDATVEVDDITMTNVFVKEIRTRRFINQYVPNLTIDNLYLDFVSAGTNASYGLAPLVAWFHNSDVNNTTVAIRNSQFRGVNEKQATYSACLLDFQGHPGMMEAIVENNVFVDAATDCYIGITPNMMDGLTVKGNTFVTNRGSAMIDVSNIERNYIVDADANLVDDGFEAGTSALALAGVTIADNNFIGARADEAFVGWYLGEDIVKFTNTFFTTDAENYLTGMVGNDSGKNSEDYYWLDMARTVKNTDLMINAMDAGSSAVMNLTYSNATNTMAFSLVDGTTDGMVVDLPEGVTGGFYADLEGEAIVIDSADLGETTTFYYVITNGTAKRIYTVTVYSYEVEDFSEAYPAEGDIGKDALLVALSLAGTEDGAKINRAWEGVLYSFTMGTNAFGSLADAAAYAAENSIESPQILYVEHEEGTDLAIPAAMQIYAPNYDTMPYIADGYGVESPSYGADWEENPDYMDNQLIVKNIDIAAAVAGTVSVNGVTMTARYTDTKRSNTAAPVDITLKNILVNGTDGGNQLFFMNNSSTKSQDNADVFLGQNIYIKKVASGTRLSTEWQAATTTFDGLWIPAGNDAGLTGMNYVKTAGAVSTYSIINSNIRDWYPKANYNANIWIFQGNEQDPETSGIGDGLTRAIVYENNILHNHAQRIGGSANLTTATWYMIYWYANRYSDFTFTGNVVNVANDPNGFGNLGFFNTHGISADTADLPAYGTVTITGNIINGINGGQIQIDGGGLCAGFDMEIHSNFATYKYTEDLENAVGRRMYVNSAHTSIVGTTSFYMDVAMTEMSDVIYDYGFTAIDGKFGAVDATREIGYKVEENDTRVTFTDNQAEVDADTTGATTLRYTAEINLSDLPINDYYNMMTLKHAETESSKVITGTSTSGLKIYTYDAPLSLPIELTLEVSSPDGTADPEIWTVTLDDTLDLTVPTFKDAYDGTIISKDALLFDESITESAGTVISRVWEGKTYLFTVGTDAFASLTDLYSYADSESIATPSILVASWGKDGDTYRDFEITRSAKFYAPNYDTVPFVRPDNWQAATSLGANWTENADYMANKDLVKARTIRLTSAASGVIEVYGFSLTGNIDDNARTEGSANTSIVFKNILKDGVDYTGYFYNSGSNASSYDTTKCDTLDLVNVYIKSLDNSFRLMGEALPHKTTIDGMWLDATAYTINNRAFVKFADADETSFTMKNSNIRGYVSKGYTAAADSGISFESYTKAQLAEGQTRTITFDNNILYDWSGKRMSSGKTYSIIWWYDSLYTGLNFTNNYVANPSAESGTAFFYNNNGTDGIREDGSIVITGNVMNGVSATLQVNVGSNAPASDKMVINNNFWVGGKTVADITTATGVVPLALAGHTGDYVNYLDYAKTKPSNKIYDIVFTDKIVVDENDDHVLYFAAGDATTYSTNDIFVNNLNYITYANPYETAYTDASGNWHRGVGNNNTITVGTLSPYAKWKVTIRSADQSDISLVETPYTLYIAKGFSDNSITSLKVGDATAVGVGNAYTVDVPNEGSNEAIALTVGDYATSVIYAAGDDTKTPVTNVDVAAAGTANYVIEVTSTIGEVATYTLAVSRPTADRTNLNAALAAAAEKAENDYTAISYAALTTAVTAAQNLAADANQTTVDNATTAINDAITALVSKVAYNEALAAAEAIDTSAYCAKTVTDFEAALADAETAIATAADADDVAAVVADIEAADELLAVCAFTNYVYDNNATCIAGGTKTAACDNGCGETDTIDDPDHPATGNHVFGEYTSNGDVSCYKDGTKTATCTTEGCTATDTIADSDYPATGNHVWGTYVSNNDATCIHDGTKTATCTTEGCIATDTVDDENTATGEHVYGEYTSNNDATCFEDGTKTATCTTEGCTATDVVDDVGSSAGAHTWGEYVYDNNANCFQSGTKTATCTTEGCGKTDTIADTDHPATGEHVWGTYVSNNDATCFEDGTKTAQCQTPGCTATDVKADEGTATGNHVYGEYVSNGDASCFEDGTKTATCTTEGCTATDVKADEGSATGNHVFTNYVSNNDASCYKDGTKTATCDTEGCTAKDTVKDTGSATGNHVFGEYVYNNDATKLADGTETAECTTEGCTATDTRTKAGTKLPSVTFTDVKKGAFYEVAVDWAVANGITTGATETTFEPGSACTRAQAVTFLWRAAGCPEPTVTTTSFTDIKETGFYYKAVLWAVEKGITTGTSATTFSPNDKCTRGQIVTFLWRTAGSPKSSIKSPFTDVKSTSFCYEAVLWAVENGITTGTTATTFAPNQDCTRGHIVTFLYRAQSDK